MPRQIQNIFLVILIVLAVSPFLGSRVSDSSQAPATGSITGTVDDQDGQPVRFANVILLQTHLGAMTDRAGRFRIANVPPGEYLARATFLGYLPAEMAVVVHDGEEVVLRFTLRNTVGTSAPIEDPHRVAMVEQSGDLREQLRSRPAELRPVQDAFAARLHQEFASAGGNVVHSPLCVAAACGLLLRGARGETAREIAAMLRVDPNATALLGAIDTLRAFLESSTGAQGDQWSMANGAWFDDDVHLRPEFVASVRSMPADKVAVTDFSGAPERSRDTINRWIREGTYGKVPELLAQGSIGRGTALVLANAMYLHARWLQAFGVRQTIDEAFWVRGTDSTSVPTMHSTVDVPYGADKRAQVIRLDYLGGDIGMVIVLPRARDGLADLERRLDADRIQTLRRSLAPTRVELRLPRWQSGSTWDLKPAMRRMGIWRAFALGECDLSGAIENAGHGSLVYVSDAIHAATVDVGEKGTEASAATAVAAVTLGLDEPGPDAEIIPLHIDHPFLWWIQENTTGTILFMGRVVDPRSEGTRVTERE